MSKVDNRIVEMGFENKGFEKGIKDSQASLKDFDKSLTNMASNSAPLSSLGSIVNGIGGKFSLLGTIGVGALLNIGAQAVTAGQQLVKSMGVDQIMAGFSEYELKINSIKVMLAGGRTKEGLPVTLEMVNSELEKLNAYSDQTIYSFSDMTKNIGKFTNAGVDLETAVQAIKGIANAAALSGANSEEAARAMYNFAQALSAGYVKLIDWKSIENANMATVEFKNQLLESAVAAGTLEKQADGMYKVLSSGRIISATKDFNDSLQDQWMNTETLTSTLARYADATTDIGAKATEAATKVRTFHQLMDTTKEALGSGWAMTFEHFFGDYDEATKLWTAVSDTVGGMIQRSNDARNDLLKTWKAFGGRIKILDGLSSAWKSLSLIFGLVKETFKNVFPPITVTTLMRISIGFEKLMKSLKPSLATLSSLKKIFKGVFSAVFLAWKILTSVFTGLVDGIKLILSVIPTGKNGGILGFLAKLADFFTNLNKAAKDGEVFKKISEAISGALGSIVESGSIFVKIYGGIVKGIEFLLNKIKDFFGSFKSVDTSGVTESFDKILKMVNAPSAQEITDFLKSIKKAFKGLKDFLGQAWNTLGFEGFTDILKVFITGGIGISIIKFFKSFTGLGEKFVNNIVGVSANIKNFFGVTGVMSQLQGTLKAYQNNLNSKQLLTIAGAIAILVASLAILTFLDEKKMLVGIGLITALFGNLSGAMLVLSKSGGGLKGSVQMMAMANSILILTGALYLLKGVEANSIYALSAIIGELVLANVILGKMKNPKVASINLFGMATAITVLALAARIFGTMKPEELKQGIVAISILMGEMLLFSVVMGNMGGKAGSMLAAGISMSMIALALLQLVGVVAILAQFKPEKLLVGLGGLAAIMGILAIGMLTLANPKVIFGAAAMIILAGAITMFVPAIITLGSLPMKTIAQGLLAIAGIFAVLGIAGLVLGPILPVILGAAAAIALLGIAMLAAGAGMLLFGTGLGLIAVAGAGAISILVLAMTAMISLIPLLLKKVGEGLVALAVVIGEAAPEIMTALGKLITEFLALVVTQIPAIAEAGMQLILGFLKGISDNIGPIIETIFQMLINILDAITEKLPDLLTAGADLIIAFLTGIANEQVRIIDAAFTAVLTFINGLADSIRENTPLLLEAVGSLCTAFIDGVKEYFNIGEGESIAKNVITGLVNGVTSGVDLVVQAVKDLGDTVLAAIKKVLGIASPSKETETLGEYLDLGLIRGLKNKANGVVAAAKEVGESSINALRSTMSRISDAVDSEINSSPVITPVLDLSGIKSNANNLNRLLSSGQSYNLASAKVRDDKYISRSNQNGSDSLGGTTQIVNNSFNLNGVTIRSDADIDKLATELYRKQENAMRSRGIRPAYSN